MDKRVTIKDVAERAGVSKATVSYVLNGVRKVSPATRDKVMKAIDELDYSPDFTAISLSKRQSNLIGILLPLKNESIEAIMKENTYFNEMISGIELVARQNNYDILLTGIGHIEDHETWVRKRNVDGLLFLGAFPEEMYRIPISVPSILIDVYEEQPELSSILIDDYRGGYLATKHLLELNHTKIAFISTGSTNSVEGERLRGYTDAMGATKHLIVAESLHNFESGYQIGERIVKEKLDITGFVVTSDITAIGMLKAFHDAGKHVPEDYSVVGFDDISMSKYAIPALTTIHQPTMEKGQLATRMLLRRMQEKDAPVEKQKLDVELIIRESTARFN
ncbi:LacI family DNA-binding transcriptional regulator [Paenalkalicoccus suaedae]|uniref:LacI family DNA-binding transcriptional regulator n=1 Tax=Paenalkalicoccus suaedae TaxID=2592382 RepID=A0A859FBD5_9BACI|nr:LacI family DNA-binding transcriptional regulator [Paenalkalicoccus suaedae]QKS70138.1 LacI family DNA-binding transcriptional regulator [Paenalkalicoccus suaedae]